MVPYVIVVDIGSPWSMKSCFSVWHLILMDGALYKYVNMRSPHQKSIGSA